MKKLVSVVAMCLAGAVVPVNAAAQGAHTNPVGLVLSGGGAKGAYEIGVWQTLQEVGIASNITAISGTSVGALNAALFAACPDDAEKLWMENVDGAFRVNADLVVENVSNMVVEALSARTADDKSGIDWRRLAKSLYAGVVKKAAGFFSGKLQEGYLDSSLFAKMLDDKLPQSWPANAAAVYATAVEKGLGGKTRTWRINSEPHERRILMLRASAAIPFGFDSVSIDGKNYIDAGFEFKACGMKILDGDNVPLQPIIDSHPEIRTVIVVYLADKEHIDKKRREKNQLAADAAKVRLLEIIPSKNIGISLQKVGGNWKVGGAVDTSPERARELIDLGRKDAREALAKAGLEKYVEVNK